MDLEKYFIGTTFPFQAQLPIPGHHEPGSWLESILPPELVIGCIFDNLTEGSAPQNLLLTMSDSDLY